MGSTPERVSPEHPLPAMGSAGLGKLLGLFCKERVEDGCGGLLDEGDRPSLKRERSGKWKGRSAAEGCTSEARKPGETPCGRERGRAPLAAFAVVLVLKLRGWELVIPFVRRVFSIWAVAMRVPLGVAHVAS